jgi:hypothetical protein
MSETGIKGTYTMPEHNKETSVENSVESLLEIIEYLCDKLKRIKVSCTNNPSNPSEGIPILPDPGVKTSKDKLRKIIERWQRWHIEHMRLVDSSKGRLTAIREILKDCDVEDKYLLKVSNTDSKWAGAQERVEVLDIDADDAAALWQGAGGLYANRGRTSRRASVSSDTTDDDALRAREQNLRSRSASVGSVNSDDALERIQQLNEGARRSPRRWATPPRQRDPSADSNRTNVGLRSPSPFVQAGENRFHKGRFPRRDMAGRVARENKSSLAPAEDAIPWEWGMNIRGAIMKARENGLDPGKNAQLQLALDKLDELTRSLEKMQISQLKSYAEANMGVYGLKQDQIDDALDKEKSKEELIKIILKGVWTLEDGQIGRDIKNEDVVQLIDTNFGGRRSTSRRSRRRSKRRRLNRGRKTHSKNRKTHPKNRKTRK